jgi:hypothetical protein
MNPYWQYFLSPESMISKEHPSHGHVRFNPASREGEDPKYRVSRRMS